MISLTNLDPLLNLIGLRTCILTEVIKGTRTGSWEMIEILFFLCINHMRYKNIYFISMVLKFHGEGNH